MTEAPPVVTNADHKLSAAHLVLIWPHKLGETCKTGPLTISEESA